MVEVKKNFLNEWTISFAFPFNKMNEIILIKYDMGVKVDMWCNCLLFVHFFFLCFFLHPFSNCWFCFYDFQKFSIEKGKRSYRSWNYKLSWCASWMKMYRFILHVVFYQHIYLWRTYLVRVPLKSYLFLHII